MRAIIMILYF